MGMPDEFIELKRRVERLEKTFSDWQGLFATLAEGVAQMSVQQKALKLSIAASVELIERLYKRIGKKAPPPTKRATNVAKRARSGARSARSPSTRPSSAKPGRAK
jgi:hypothetical protein